MENLPRSCRRSEKHLLPRPLCEHCQRPRRPRWTEATGVFEETIDPDGTVRYECSTPFCTGNSPL